MSQEKTKNLVPRPPVVVVMGHVDHGKTSLLDYIRKTNVIAREAGGITQSIGAYEVSHGGKKITFIDTPGHEAFSKMRARGAHVADLAILIVAADDGVQPQTKESIEILQKSNTPFVVAINKIDKSNADIEKTINDLSQNGVYLEGRGGNISWQKVAAKQGTGVDELLDLVLLAAEIENFTFDPDAMATGVIIESQMDNRRGVTAVGILKDGILKSGKHIATATACGKIKILENFLEEKADELEPSAPFLILGFDSIPETGEEFMSGDIELVITPEGKEVLAIKPKEEAVKDDGKPVLNVILKADVSGSLEALSEIVKNLKQEKVGIKILSQSVGEINDSDVKSASINSAAVIGFNIKANKAAETLAKNQNVKIVSSKIIYELIKSIEEELVAIEKPAPLGEVEILKLFSQKGKSQLVGGKVFSGLIKNNTFVKIFREGNEIGSGKISNLKILKQEATQVLSPAECGIMIESSTTIAVGDQLIHSK